MKSFTPEARAALDSGEAIVVGALEIASDPVVRVWGGPGEITFDNRRFDGVGDRSLVQIAGGALGGAAQSISLTLSGIEPKLLALVDAEEIAGASAILWRLIFSSDGNKLLDHHIWARGSLDTLVREEEVGGTATISASLETPAKGLGRRGARMRSDADQRLIDPEDGFFKNVAYAGEKEIYFGGRKPQRAGDALRYYGGGDGRGPKFHYNLP